MNRTYLQAITVLLGTVATTFVAVELRWEPANAGNYLVIVGPGAVATDEMAAGRVRREREAFAKQPRPDFH